MSEIGINYMNNIWGIFENILIIKVLSNQYTFRSLNSYYQSLSVSGKKRFYKKYSKMFREKSAPFDAREWHVRFSGKTLRIPLRRSSLWLDWDIATSVLGNQTSLKTTYSTLIDYKQSNKVFFDIGANYGIHSLLFLLHGIKTISFEPNPDCLNYFQNLCTVNGVEPCIQCVAVGDNRENLELFYPEKDAWFGTVDCDTVKTLGNPDALKKMMVPQITIDSFIKERNIVPTIIKIDTEGYEPNVIKGAKETIFQYHPLLIFESAPDSNREKIYSIFKSLDYKIYNLPILPGSHVQNLTEQNFISMLKSNFFALHQSDNEYSF